MDQALSEAQQRGDLASAALPDVLIEHPQNPEHGDFASGLPLKLARAMKMPPMTVAEMILAHIVPPPQVDRIWVAEPGFINFILKDDWLSREVESVLVADESYGDIELGKGNKIQLEFVSVNPTGPLHVG
ncbi:MAG: arginine--tRNA ligase, partial [Dehalococcoidia bacterium]|nr:arginine--tRNA ligase [Dehalococcoidia bacterium]